MIAQTWPWAGSHQCSGWPWPLEVSTSSSLAKWGDYHITGLLTFSGEVFAQFLEGPPESIHRLMDRLQVDPRHRDIIILSEGSDHERIFASWDMELVTRQEAHQVLRDALNEANSYDKVIGLSRLLSRLDPNLHRAT